MNTPSPKRAPLDMARANPLHAQAALARAKLRKRLAHKPPIATGVQRNQAQLSIGVGSAPKPDG